METCSRLYEACLRGLVKWFHPSLPWPFLLSSKWLAGLHGSSKMPTTPLLLSGWEVMIHQRQLNNGVGSLSPHPLINSSSKPPDLTVTNPCHIHSALLSCWTIKDAFPSKFNVSPLPLGLATLVSIGFHQHARSKIQPSTDLYFAALDHCFALASAYPSQKLLDSASCAYLKYTLRASRTIAVQPQHLTNSYWLSDKN